MFWVVAIQKAIDFMERNLMEPITIDEIAREANFSTFHFQRTFTLLTDTSVGEYLRRRRLTLAAEDLYLTNEKVIDIACKYGYDTPEAFAKAFRRQHGLSPTDARKSMKKVKSYNRLAIQVSLKGAEPMKYTIVEKKAFQLIGIKREYSLENEENLTGIPKLWNEVNSDGTCEKLIRLNNGELKAILGVCVVPDERTNENIIEYWVAAEHTGKVPEGLFAIDIPASKWAIFEVHGAMPDAIQKVWKQIFSEWFPSNGYEHAAGPELEVYPAGDSSREDYYSEIWIPVM